MYGGGAGQALPTPPAGNPMLSLARTYGGQLTPPAAGNPALALGQQMQGQAYGETKADPIGWLLNMIPQFQPQNR